MFVLKIFIPTRNASLFDFYAKVYSLILLSLKQYEVYEGLMCVLI